MGRHKVPYMIVTHVRLEGHVQHHLEYTPYLHHEAPDNLETIHIDRISIEVKSAYIAFVTEKAFLRALKSRKNKKFCPYCNSKDEVITKVQNLYK